MLRLLAAYLLYSCRRRIPVYADDRSKAAQRLAREALRLLGDPEVGHFLARRAARIYGGYFQSGADARRFLRACARGGRDAPIEHAAPAFRTQLRRIAVEMAPEAAPGGKRVLVYAAAPLSREAMDRLAPFQEIVVLSDHHHGGPCLRASIEARWAGEKTVSARRIIAEYAPAFTAAEREVSDLCDDAAQALVSAALETPSIRRFAPALLDEDLALHLSDIMFRAAEDANAALRLAREMKPDERLALADPPPSLGDAIASIAPGRVLWLDGVRLTGAGGGASAAGEGPGVGALLRLVRMLRRRIGAALPDASAFAGRRAVLAADRSISVYRETGRLAMDALAAALETKGLAMLVDVGPSCDAPYKALLRGGALHAAVNATALSETALLASGAEQALGAFLERRTLAGAPASALRDCLGAMLHRHLREVIGVVVLFKLARDRLGPGPAVGLLSPGRDPRGRAIARAFQARGKPTIDVQSVMVSEHPRYKKPITDHCAVIDSFSRDIYKAYGLNEEALHVIGSLTHDQEIRAVDGADRAKAFEEIFLDADDASGSNPACSNPRRLSDGAPPEEAILYAPQPLIPLDEQIDAACRLAGIIAGRERLRLCVKLHPAQPDADRAAIEAALQEPPGLSPAARERMRVRHRAPFAPHLAACDVLVGYFSNVCLLGPVFSIPVLTLPTRTPTPETTMEMMGAATAVRDLDRLEEAVTEALARKRSGAPAGRDYLAANPHMADRCADRRLAALALETLDAQGCANEATG